jgi:hypothetical protein
MDTFFLTPKLNEMNNRVVIGGIIGGVVFFFLGFLVYGMALRVFMEQNQMAGLGRSDEEFNWLFLILGNLAFGFMVSYVLHKANANSFGSGAVIALIVGLLMGLGLDFTMYATTNTYSNLAGVLVDVVVTGIMGSIVGGVVGWWYGRGRQVAIA